MVASVVADSNSDEGVADDWGVAIVSDVFLAEDVQDERPIAINIKLLTMTRLILSFLFLLR
jgi:hypothetical protein